MTTNDLRFLYLFPLAKSPLAPEDFFVLLANASGKSREFLLAHPEYEFDAKAETRIRAYFARRLAHEPVAYITGEKEFFGLPFRMTRDTLIPRPETEQLVEHVIGQITTNNEQESKRSKSVLIADIGTGSGAIIISLAHALKKRDSQFAIRNSQFTFHATDISKDALVVAKENAKRNGVAEDISFHRGNLLEPMRHLFHEADEAIIIANLPYLSETIYMSADDDVKKYEPKNALLSGHDGLDHYRALFASITKELSMTSLLRLSVFCEISPEQAVLITALFNSVFPGEISQLFPDLSGRSRIFFFRINKA